MKAWLIYWFVGCAIVGIPMGSLMKDCPDADVKAIDIFVTVATWPVFILAGNTSGPIKRTSQCPATVSRS